MQRRVAFKSTHVKCVLTRDAWCPYVKDQLLIMANATVQIWISTDHCEALSWSIVSCIPVTVLGALAFPLETQLYETRSHCNRHKMRVPVALSRCVLTQ